MPRTASTVGQLADPVGHLFEVGEFLRAPQVMR